ncbi:M28 family metallopeptidase [Micromonospora sp. WMMC250]|uniref:M28 family metallopeptidase n=1 Tax=Micromonospora sp. WMMC250 TaxID=3014781 RepID=UPI0022B62885|nr:M28 family peptidase [Micromonospora sp. WMMC250]MCZ7373266.1 M28 family peptidase [Micromonospora sp. WMMC250]MCZ7373305.1 M28 family peptidase [Micromonospora sp. WMMC250]MCZ7379916.1 M28 family peptidase [Micromonospora sp. WMMC250]
MSAPSGSAAHLDAILPQVSAERMAATVSALAADDFTGRRVGTAGGAAARAWLVAHLANLGATVDTDDFPVRNVPELYAAPTVVWGKGDTSTRLTFGREVAVHCASADTSEVRRGPLGVAGSGDPAGRWLVVPTGGNPLDAARDASGAAGLLLSRAVDADGWQYTVLAGPDPGPLPILTLDAGTHRAVLAAVTGKGWCSANTPLRRRDVTGTNIHARFPAAQAGGIEVLLTAHYDGVGDRPGLRQPGASDNASGVAVVLEAARILAAARPVGVGVGVALLDAEEVGALGSAHHSQQLQAGDVRPLVINVDGAGLLDQAAAVEAGGPAHALLALLDQAGRHTGLPLAAGPVASDNRRYAAAGLAAVGIGAGMAGYHSPADTPDRVDPHTLEAIARLVVATVCLAASTHATVSSSIGDKR